MAVRHTGNRHDAKGRSTTIPADAKLRAMLRPPEGEPWCWMTARMLASPAFRSLSRMALQCLFRIAVEHMAHGGRENGALIVTHSDFVAHGMRAASIAEAIRELERAGFIEVTCRGGRNWGAIVRPSRFRLTWLPTREGSAPTNDWQQFSDTKKSETPDAESRAARTRKRV